MCIFFIFLVLIEFAVVTSLIRRHQKPTAEKIEDFGTYGLPIHRGRKGIFNCFSKFSKLIFDLSGLIDQNESKISNFIPIWLYLVVKVSKRAKNSWKKPKITLIPCFSEQNLSWQIRLISIAIIWGKKVWCYYISFEVIFSHFVKKKCHFRIY